MLLLWGRWYEFVFTIAIFISLIRHLAMGSVLKFLPIVARHETFRRLLQRGAAWAATG